MQSRRRQVVLLSLAVALFGACSSANEVASSGAPAGEAEASSSEDADAAVAIDASKDASKNATKDAAKDASDAAAPVTAGCDPTKPFSTYTPLLAVSTSISAPHTGSETIRGAHVTADERTVLFVVNFSLVPDEIFTATRSSITAPFGPRRAELGLNNGVEPEGSLWMTDDALTAYITSQAGPGNGLNRLYRFTRAAVGASWSGSTLAPGLIEAGSTDRLATPFVANDHIYFSRYANNGPVRLYEASLVGAPALHPVSELNVGTAASYPVLTPDALTIFWVDNRINMNVFSVWRADRSTTTDPFSNARPAINITNGRAFVPVGVSADACRLYVIGSPLVAGTGQDQEIAVLGR